MSWSEKIKEMVREMQNTDGEKMDAGAIDERLHAMNDHADAVAVASGLVDNLGLTDKGPLYQATRQLSVACVAFLYDWGNPEDLNAGGLQRLSLMGLRDENRDFKTPLDMLFEEIETGYSIVPAALQSESDEIAKYHRLGLLTDEQLEKFTKLPSQEAYAKTKAVAEDNKRMIEQAMPGASFPWEADEKDDTDCTYAHERRRGLKQRTHYVRNSDNYAPGFAQEEDGSFGVAPGIAPEDDLALRAYRIYKSFPAETVQVAAAMFASTVCV